MSIDAILASPTLAGMRACPQWIVYVPVPNAKGKFDKIPLHYATGKPTGANDPRSWTDPITAANVAKKWGPEFGVGFCFTEASGFWFVDLDGALQLDGTWSPLAQQACHLFAGAAVEVSRSGQGLHLFGRGAIPQHASKNIAHHAELYHTDRFVALSGLHLAGDCMTDHTAAMQWFASTYFPPRVAGPGDVLADGPRADWRGPVDDDELLRRAMQSRSAATAFGADRATFADLWTADAAVLSRAYPPDNSSSEPFDRSSADAALAAHLAFWTGCDAARIERLMRQSSLVREKYDRTDYLPRTIDNACGQQRDVLQDREPPTPPVAPAADAPVMRAAEGERFLSASAQADFFKGCVYVVDQHRALVPGGKLLKPEQFRANFGGYTFAMDARNERTTRNAWEAFTESQVLTAPRADGTCFRPQLPYGSTVKSEGRSRVNTFWPVDVERKAGSIEPFERHLRLLLPHDWQTLLYFMAGVVQHPGVKFQWMPLLVGAEGNGKSFFSRCVAHAVGQRYTHWVAADKIGSQFNAWMFGKLFYAIEDLKIGGKVDAWEKLKPMITGENIEIEGKGVDQRSDEICGNFIANSNHLDAIRATRNDRRVAHLHCAQQSVDDLARDGIDEAYTRALYTWAEDGGGYAVVAEYLHTLPVPPEFGRGWLTGRAPRTSSTAAAIEHGRSAVEQAILDAIDDDRPGFRGGWIGSVMMNALIETKRLIAQFPKAARDGVLRGLGYRRHPALSANDGKANHPVAPDGGRSILYIKDGHPSLHLQRPADVARAYSAAQGVQ